MEVFALIKTVLDEAYDDLEGTEAEKDERVLAKRAQLRAAYGQLATGAGEPIEYSDPATRVAYLQCYVTSHANLVASKIAEVPELRALFTRDWIEVACIGGGPGSDFLGVAKHMLATACASSLKCFLLDRDPAWGDSWADVDRKLRDVPFRVSTHFQTLDVTQPDTWTIQKKYLNADLFTMIYFVSEIFGASATEQAQAFFAHIFQHARPGSLFLFVDNNSAIFYEWFDVCAASHGLTRLTGGELIQQLPPLEEKKSLERYFEKFGYPKLEANIAWRVYRKPS